ncbi:MAG: hypothetical protein L0H79_19175 [Intrasporangium sp.]|uniref:hypothetical protein n=1 Tax=Intrasporangium sp. TaxID=1925024 RepID=UPI0026481A85|nr:hypothetical protein [Intrasporangium sp.]MDN5797849.1 hypothetical protein [Intrasporangium sp.]
MFDRVHDPERTGMPSPKRSAVGGLGASGLLRLQQQAGNAALVRSLRLSPGTGPVVLQRALVADKLNVVGETHTESDSRRPAEKAFGQAKTGSANYWTEAEFPDLHMAVSGRKARGQAQPQGDARADLMEYRAIHAAALLVGQYERTAQAARALADSPAMTAPSEGNALPPALRTFLDVDFRKLVKYKERVKKAWTATQSQGVNDAVQRVFEYVEKIAKMFMDTMKTVSERRKALLFLLGAADLLKQHAAPLAAAGGVPGSTNVAQDMRIARSRSMGLAAEFSSQKGVWKVGDLHVADVLDGTTQTRQVKANYERKDAFNTALATWEAQQNGT